MPPTPSLDNVPTFPVASTIALLGDELLSHEICHFALANSRLRIAYTSR